MRISKVVLTVLLVMVLIGLGTPAFGQKRYSTRTSRPLETTGIFTDEGGVTMDYSVWIYGITIYADAASSFVGVYDCDTLVELNSGTEYAKDEVGEPTQYERTSVWYDTPMYYEDGVAGIIGVGVAFVHYGPEP